MSHRSSIVTTAGLVEITGDPALARDRARDGHDAFLADHWPDLSAAAWDGFLRYGAGAVVLWRERAPGWGRARPFVPERLWYATQAHTLPGADAERDFDGWPAQLIERYDPRREAVVVILEGACRRGYAVAGDVAPVEAHRRAQARLN